MISGKMRCSTAEGTDEADKWEDGSSIRDVEGDCSRDEGAAAEDKWCIAALDARGQNGTFLSLHCLKIKKIQGKLSQVSISE